MKHFLRPYHGLGVAVLLAVSVGMLAGPRNAIAQSTDIVELLQGTNPLLGHSGSQGYLGVWVDDVDNEKAQTLKLKEVRGAVITLIDHDAPAGQIGLRVNDVVLQLNGQNVEGAEQLRRMLKEIPAGHKVSLGFSRDGNIQTTSVELVDRRTMEHDVWNKLDHSGDVFGQTQGMGVFAGGGDMSLPGMFHMPIWGPTLNVGAMVEPLTAQMAEYLGVQNGLMVKQVAHKSEAATAGLKAFDVILKVGPDAVTTMSDWDRALRANQGKPVQVTILRDKKQQTLTLQVDSKRKTGELDWEKVFPAGDCAMVAELEPNEAQLFARDFDASAEKLRGQALKDQMQESANSALEAKQAEELAKQAAELSKNLKTEDFNIDEKQAEQFRKQAEALRDQMKTENFELDQKQADAMRRQMEEFRKNFKAEDFKIDQKQFDELKKQMQQFREGLQSQELESAPL